MRALAAALLIFTSCRREELPVIAHVPAFTMPDQHGREVSDASLRGQTVVVDFFYAQCTTVCPVITARMKEVQDAVLAREKTLGRALPIHFVSITLDPDSDTPEVLAAYAAQHGADDARWSFLSGRSADLDRVVVQGFKMTYTKAAPSAGITTIMHGDWLVLVDGSGAIRGYYSASEPARKDALVRDALRLAGAP